MLLRPTANCTPARLDRLFALLFMLHSFRVHTSSPFLHYLRNFAHRLYASSQLPEVCIRVRVLNFRLGKLPTIQHQRLLLFRSMAFRCVIRIAVRTAYRGAKKVICALNRCTAGNGVHWTFINRRVLIVWVTA